jgi:uncharacterized protein YcfJ
MDPQGDDSMNTKTSVNPLALPRPGARMRNLAAALALGMVAGLPVAALADDGLSERYTQYADVVAVTPLYRTVTVSVPRESCYEEIQRIRYEPEPRRPRGTAARTVAGGVIGGVIGRQFGDGDGRDAMTVLGTLIGAAVGHDSARARHEAAYVTATPRRARYRTVERCEIREELRTERELDGYEVTYEYMGREFTTLTEGHPGSRIAIEVELTPLEQA